MLKFPTITPNITPLVSCAVFHLQFCSDHMAVHVEVHKRTYIESPSYSISCTVVQQVCFETGPLQCRRDVPQHLNVLSILITIGLMQIDGHKRTVFNILAFCEAFLRMSASYINDIKHIFILRMNIKHIYTQAVFMGSRPATS